LWVAHVSTGGEGYDTRAPGCTQLDEEVVDLGMMW
jgi:hypothetical protein